MTPSRPALVMAAALCLYASAATAQPILEAQPYSGPIPQSSVSLRIGALLGASNDEMIQYLDERVRAPFQSFPEDFGSGLTIEASYMYKPHPRFAWRVNGSASFLSYTSTGDFVPQVPADSLLPELNFSRELSVQLFILEASGVYFFEDASKNDLQPYLGGGFSVGFPHESYTESWTDVDTGQPFTAPIPGRPSDVDEWDINAGVHAVLGVLYYFNPRWALSAETRAQFMEGRFDQLQAYDPSTGEYENVTFVIDYSGFFLAIGATYNF